MKRRNPESGFALLFVYAMAATVAIMLYMELPRVAFEAQRDKEQLLIDRGEQYSRAVNLYVRKFNRYPVDFDALQSTQNLRFLRHKYVDPMTGKDDWRIIHVGPGGVFTDSLVYGKKKDGKPTEQQNFITEMQQTGGNPAGPAQGVNIGTRQRQSDQPGAPGAPNNPSQPGLFPGGTPPPGTPQYDPSGQPIPNSPMGTNGPVQVLPDGRIVPVFPQGNQPGVPNPFQPGTTGLPPGVQLPPGVNFPGQQFPGGAPGQQFPGGTPGQPPNGPPAAAANLINQILTTPRPGGLNGLGGQQATVDQNGNPAPQGKSISSLGNNNTGTALAPMAGQTIGGGIAGVASKLEQDGIKIYRDRTPYNEWEFVYDITKDPSRGGGGGVPQQTGTPPPTGTNPPATK